MDTFQFILSVLNSTGVRLFIICISVIAILALFRERLLGCSDKPSQPKQIHTYYISGILLLLLIQLGSYIAVVSDPKGETLMQYISFAATLSSLILSILAIIYTMVSNSKGDTHVAKLESASSKPTSSSEVFKLQMESLKTVVNSIEEFNGLATDLKEALGQEIKQISNKLQSDNKYIKAKLARMVSNGQSLDMRDGNTMSFEKHLTGSSLMGALAIYIFFVATEKKISKIPVDWFTSCGVDGSYSCGYLIATASIFPIRLKVEAEDNKMLFIHSLENNLDFNSERCEDLLNLAYSKDEEVKELFYNYLGLIKDNIKKLSNKDSCD